MSCDHDCDCGCCFEIICRPCKPKPPCPACKDKCGCGNGEVRTDLGEIKKIDLTTLPGGDLIKLPPTDEFTTSPISEMLEFTDGGAEARLKYTGTRRALVEFEAKLSFQRVDPTLDQHLLFLLNVGPDIGALTDATAVPTTLQRTNLLADNQDNALSVGGTEVMEPGHVAEIWMGKQEFVPPVPDAPMNFFIQGFVFTAKVIRYLD